MQFELAILIGQDRFCSVDTLVASFNGGRRLVLSSEMNPPLGRLAFSLRSDEVGWSIEHAHYLSAMQFPDLKSADFDSFYARLVELIESEGDLGTISIRSSSGLDLTLRPTRTETDDEFLWNRGVDLRLFRDVPSEIQSSVVDLKRILCAESFAHCGLLELLAGAIEAHGVPLAEGHNPVDRWRRVRGTTRLGYELSPEERTFLESFDSFSSANPFAGTCLDGRIPGEGD